MSKLIVEVCEVAEIKPHPNADRLEVASIRGWDVIVQKDLVKPGDPVVYFPPDSVLTEELADRLGIRKYLAAVKTPEETRYRVKAARLRGLPSYGTIDHQVPEGLKVGDDVAELFGVTKWEPPVDNRLDGPGVKGGKRAASKPNFPKYYDMEHIKNHRDAFEEGAQVVVTEKLHGSSLRVGYIKVDKEYDGVLGWVRRTFDRLTGRPAHAFEFVAGSHNVERRPQDDEGRYTDYAIPLENGNIREMLRVLSDGCNDVVVYGELIGSGVQDMAYGHKDGSRGYALFDLSINGKYVDADIKQEWFGYHDVPSVPVLYTGPFSWNLVDDLTDGPTMMCEPADAGKFKGREGIVITSMREPAMGRRVFKSVSADYLARKNPTDSH